MMSQGSEMKLLELERRCQRCQGRTSVGCIRQVTPGCLVKIERNGNAHVLKFFSFFCDSYIYSISEQK